MRSVLGVGRGACSVVLVGCLVLGAGAVSASAAEGDRAADSASPIVGGFGLGDGVEGLIDERVGSFSFAVAVAGLGLRWDSRSIGVDRVGFGSGWMLSGLWSVSVTGGIRVFTPSGDVVDADASVPSGLAGYVLGDVVFSQTGGVLRGRVDGLVGDREYGFVLSQTGGTTTYFAATGARVAQVDGFGNRTDWVTASDGSNRLVRVVDPLGVVTGVDWSNPAAVRVTRSAGMDTGTSGVVELDGGSVTGVVDPMGGRTTIGYDSSGSISRITAVSGAVTEVSWQTLVDGSRAVDRVRVINGPTGAELSAREWDAVTEVASGWPVYTSESDVFSSGDSGFRYQTAVSDGATRVISEYNSNHLLINRALEVSTESGPMILQNQALEYPGAAGGTVPEPWDLPQQFNRPTTARAVFHDSGNRERTTSEHYEFDTYGRATSHTSVGGSVRETTYDDTVRAGGVLPIGLPLTETVTTTEGLVSQTRYELNEARTAHTVAETFAGKKGEELTRTGRSEYTVDPDGFVSEERQFEQGGGGTPVVIAYAKDVDLESGTVTAASTLAAGTEFAVTTSEVTDVLVGQPVSQTGPVGNTGTAEYDPVGRVTANTDPAGRTTRTKYLTAQADGVNATVVTTPDGVVTTTETDVLGRVVRITDNLKDGAPMDGQVRVVQSRAYPDAGTVEITDAWGAVTITKQDVFGREVQTRAPTGLVKTSRYDDVAHTITTGLTPTGNLADAESTSTQLLDDAGQVTATSGTRADAGQVPTVQSVYDGFGREMTTTDGTTRTEVARDVFGNPTSTTVTPQEDEGIAFVAERRFDETGTSVEKTLIAGGQSRSGGYRTLDILGRTETETNQVGSTTTYRYTPDGLVAEAVTGYGQVTTNTYDPATRNLTERVTTSPIGEQVSTRSEYDPVTGDLRAVFDPADRAGTEVSYTYDGFHNPTRITYPDGKRITHTYDPNGRRTSTTDIAGNTTTYRHDPAGLLTTAVQTDAAGVEIGRVRYTVDEYARVTEMSRGNDVTTRYTFTSHDEIATETTTGPDGTVQDDREYTYDGRGNLILRVDTTTDGTTTTLYAYDEHDRLTHSSVHQGDTAEGLVLSATTYLLTVSGDISRETVNARDPDTGVTSTTVREFIYTPTGEIAGITTTRPEGSTTATPAYDAAGNLTTAVDGTRYTYNATNQPVTETTPTGDTLTTAYWATGERAHLTVQDGPDSGEARFYWDESTLINDTHAQGENPAGIASYLIGTTRHTRTTTSETRSGSDTVYYTQDRHGNTTTLTDTDGIPFTRYAYTDYGSPRTTAPATGAGSEWIGDLTYQPFQYAGEDATPSGRQYLHARTYDPATMRFTTKDTAQLHNTYNYADLNPVMMTDPTGRTAQWERDLSRVLGWGGVALAVYSAGAAVSTLLTGGLAALGWAGGAALIGGLLADVGSAGLMVGRMLAEDAGESGSASFFTSGAALGIEIGLGVVGVVAAGYLTFTAAKSIVAKGTRARGVAATEETPLVRTTDVSPEPLTRVQQAQRVIDKAAADLETHRLNAKPPQFGDSNIRRFRSRWTATSGSRMHGHSFPRKQQS
ncbi:RHS repeat domain-containing protein [Microbacterium rhizomatis]|uniref:RHS repeat-associated core domain-containing protein n=1 Tax=Microbacterium rhizomatis TaxID=1631477 RepID=A0A5J5J366_9MICO|nr:RHS repeat-associated core domain-containing protein [Microbacterium rhizomatis]KAA9108019.1 RHS repeat-associated core domain-containing protein [Microbacterium rhizomatis]